MKFSIQGFFSKCDQIRTNCDLVTFTEEILNGKPHFLCSDYRDIEYLKLRFQRSSIAYFKVDIKTHWNSVELHSTRKPLINIVDLTKVNIEINKHWDGDLMGQEFPKGLELTSSVLLWVTKTSI